MRVDMIRRAKRTILVLGLSLLSVGFYILLNGKVISDDSLCSCAEARSTPWISSTCSSRASARGAGQKVISYSFFGPIRDEKGFLNWNAQGLKDNADQIPKFLGPDWTMRVYHDHVSYDEEKRDFLCHLQCHHQHVDLCFAGHIPGYPDLQEVEGTTWRFLPLADPLVDVFHSRDLDSRFSEREMGALDEFHGSKHMFHVIRDHPNHRASMLAGLWGAKPSLNHALGQEIVSDMLKADPSLKDEGNKFVDQVMLHRIVFPRIKDQVLEHSSYHCGLFGAAEIRPFPTQRKEEAFNFVGAIMFGNVDPVLIPCPPPCRPKDHKDWTYC